MADEGKLDQVRKGSRKYQFKGKGQVETTLIVFDSLIKLAGLFDTPIARGATSNHIRNGTRVLGGDLGVINEVVHNHQSTEDVNRMARESMNIEQVDVVAAGGSQGALITMADVEKMMKDYASKMVKDEVKKLIQSNRRKELYDQRIEHKRKLELMEKEHENTLEIKKHEHDIEKEKSTTVDKERTKIKEEEESKIKLIALEAESKRQDRKEEREHMLEMMALKERMRSSSPTPPVVNVITNNNMAPPAPSPVAPVTQNEPAMVVPTAPEIPVPAQVPEGIVPPTLAQYSQPVTVSRVAEFLYAMDTFDAKFRNQMLQTAGRLASKSIKQVLIDRGNGVVSPYKLTGLFDSKYTENVYKDEDYDKVVKVVQEAYKQQQAKTTNTMVK